MRAGTSTGPTTPLLFLLLLLQKTFNRLAQSALHELNDICLPRNSPAVDNLLVRLCPSLLLLLHLCRILLLLVDLS